MIEHGQTSPDHTPKPLIIPGQSTPQPNAQIILPDGVSKETIATVLAASGRNPEYENMEPGDIFVAELEKARRDITKITTLEEKLLTQALIREGDRSSIYYQESDEAGIVHEAKLGREPRYLFDECIEDGEFSCNVELNPDMQQIPYILQLKPEWKKVFFHPHDGTQIAIKN